MNILKAETRIEFFADRIKRLERLEKTEENEQIKKSLGKVASMVRNKMIEEISKLNENLGGN